MRGCRAKGFSAGDEVLSRAEYLNLVDPIQKSLVTDWEAMQQIWQHTFCNELRVNPREHAVLLTEPPLNPKTNRERMTETIFDYVNVAALYLINAPALALYSTGRITGIVLDSRLGAITIVPIVDGYIIPDAVRTLAIGGTDIIAYLGRLLEAKGYSFRTATEMAAVDDIKEKLCYTAIHYDEEVKLSEISDVLEKIYVLDKNSSYTLAAERFKCAEILFKPAKYGVGQMGIHQLLCSSIESCAEEIQSNMLENIVLCGGCILSEGFSSRLKKKEFRLLTANGIIIHKQKMNSSWYGGSILSSRSYFHPMCITFEEYYEIGPSIINSDYI